MGPNDRVDKPVKAGDIIFFRYKNWREETHDYCVSVEGISLGTYDPGGTHLNIPDREDNLQWVLHGQVVTRDGAARPGRRTFMLEGIKDVLHK